ncbi:hypothetical protein AB1Y20_021482 [Prymnesium parvum]|uniref:J domain-containing protein n=1 Tax=Prymnesium parvum TaxID=97485 RepID=A0AB34JK92_PRYPA
MPSFVNNRLMDVAAELEEYYDRSRQRAEQAHADALSRISQLEVQAMQHQLTSLRLEAQLHDATASRAQLEQQCQSLQDENARLREMAMNGEDKKDQLDRINELSRELIATRFQLARVVAGDSHGATPLSSPKPSAARLGAAPLDSRPQHTGAPSSRRRRDSLLRTDSTAPAAEPPPSHLWHRGVPALMRAVSSLDLQATNDILNPACFLVAPMTESGGSVREERTDDAADDVAAGAEGADEQIDLEHTLGTALHLLCTTDVPSAERDRLDVEGVDALEAAGRAGVYGESSIDSVCAIMEGLLLRGASPDFISASGETPLHAASRAALLAPAALLIENSASVDALDGQGRAPMHVAAEAGSSTLVRLLLRHGADASIRDAAGCTPLDLASKVASEVSHLLSAAATEVVATLRDPTLQLVNQAKRANALYRKGSFVEATASYLQALELAGAHADVCHPADRSTLHFNCARSALKESRYVLALEQATAALDGRADYANALMLQAECYMELLEFTEAAAAYTQLTRLEPDNRAWPECHSKAVSLADASPYDVLGVSLHAEGGEIKRGYHQQCLQWHPDKHTSSAEATRRANTMFKRITAAYETLSSESKRTEYDLSVHMKEIRRRASSEAAYGFGGGSFHGHDIFSDIHNENLSSNYYSAASAEFGKDYFPHDLYDDRPGSRRDARPPFYHRWSQADLNDD